MNFQIWVNKKKSIKALKCRIIVEITDFVPQLFPFNSCLTEVPIIEKPINYRAKQ